MKKLCPIALFVLLLAALYVAFGPARRDGARGPAASAYGRETQLPVSAAPSLSSAPIAEIPGPSADSDPPHAAEGAAPAGAAADAPTPGPIAAENDLLASYGTQGTTPERLPPPGWYPAQTWTVEVWTFRMQDGDRGMWDERPTLWRFTVEGLDSIDGRNAWVIAAEPADLTGLPYNPGGKVYVSVEDHAILALRDRVQEQGEIHERFITFDDPETSAISTLLPVELPPAGYEGRARETTVGVLPPNPLRPEPAFEVPRASGKVIDVDFESDGVRVRQRWDAASPYWPLYSRTSSRVCVLRK